MPVHRWIGLLSFPALPLMRNSLAAGPVHPHLEIGIADRIGSHRVLAALLVLLPLLLEEERRPLACRPAGPPLRRRRTRRGRLLRERHAGGQHGHGSEERGGNDASHVNSSLCPGRKPEAGSPGAYRGELPPVEGVHRYRTALRNGRELSWEYPVQRVLHAARIAAPARVHGEVLPPADREGGRGRHDPRAGLRFPEQLSARRRRRRESYGRWCRR